MGNSSKRRPYLSDDGASKTTSGAPLKFGHPILSVSTYRTPNSGGALALRVGLGLGKMNQGHWDICDVNNTHLEPVDNAPWTEQLAVSGILRRPGEYVVLVASHEYR